MSLSLLGLLFRFTLPLIIFLTLTSCGHSDNQPPSSVLLTESASGSTVVLKQGQTISVSLQENSSTGYTWEREAGSELFLAQQGDSHYVPNGTAIGGGGVRTFTFLAIASGNYTLKLIYHQPWMTSVPPARTFEVAIVTGS